MSHAAHRPVALISVTDKTGLVAFARGLHALNFRLLSTGGTAKLLRDADLPVTDVSEHTGSPEILDGRVKTLHPKIHGGILFDRSKRSHRQQLDELGIEAIDLVVVNLYAFEAQAQQKKLGLEEAIEFIDIGGPCMLRAAAKNFVHCAAVIDPQDYQKCLDELQMGDLTLGLRRKLAGKVFRSISRYDTMIADYFENTADDSLLQEGITAPLPADFTLQQNLRYGENPHQKAAFYRSSLSIEGGLQDANILQGKELSFNNLLDCDAAAHIVADFPEYKAVTIVKHTNPCGAALGRAGESLREIYLRALAVDPKSAFGGIVAFNARVDAATAEELSKLFLECIVAPSFSPEAKAVLASKKNLRVLELPYLQAKLDRPAHKLWDLRSVLGGVLVQERDQVRTQADDWKLVTQTKLSAEQRDDLVFAMRLCKHVKSNAIVYVKDLVTVAVGAGQMSRVDAASFAAEKAKEFGRNVAGSVLASDAFFPFRDTVDLASRLGIVGIIQPGGSMRDEESIRAADEHGIAMVFTGIRHFKH